MNDTEPADFKCAGGRIRVSGSYTDGSGHGKRSSAPDLASPAVASVIKAAMSNLGSLGRQHD